MLTDKNKAVMVSWWSRGHTLSLFGIAYYHSMLVRKSHLIECRPSVCAVPDPKGSLTIIEY